MSNLTPRERAMFWMHPEEMAAFFEEVRAIGGNTPLRVTNGDRTRADTLSIPGAVIDGCHEKGWAMDVVPLTADRNAWVSRMVSAYQSGQFRYGQFVWYPFDGHAHIAHPNCGLGQPPLVKEGPETGFTSLVAWLSKGGKVASLLPIILVIGVLFLALKGVA